MAYGTPRSPEEIEPYYTDIRRGRPPTPRRWPTSSPGTRRSAASRRSPQLTEAQRDALQAALDELARSVPRRARAQARRPEGRGRRRRTGRRGFEPIVGLVLAPHYSSYSIGQYLDRAREGVDEAGDRLRWSGSRAGRPSRRSSTSWPTISRSASRRCASGRRRSGSCSPPTRSPADHRRRRPVPRRAARDRRRGRRPARPAEGRDWSIGWQSAGRTPEPWIGPDILDVIDELGGDPTSAASSSARADSSPTTSRCCTTSTSKPRSGPSGRARVRPHRLRERRPGVMRALAERVVASTEPVRSADGPAAERVRQPSSPSSEAGSPARRRARLRRPPGAAGRR